VGAAIETEFQTAVATDEPAAYQINGACVAAEQRDKHPSFPDNAARRNRRQSAGGNRRAFRIVLQAEFTSADAAAQANLVTAAVAAGTFAVNVDGVVIDTNTEIATFVETVELQIPIPALRPAFCDTECGAVGEHGKKGKKAKKAKKARKSGGKEPKTGKGSKGSKGKGVSATVSSNANTFADCSVCDAFDPPATTAATKGPKTKKAKKAKTAKAGKATKGKLAQRMAAAFGSPTASSFVLVFGIAGAVVAVAAGSRKSKVPVSPAMSALLPRTGIAHSDRKQQAWSAPAAVMA